MALFNSQQYWPVTSYSTNNISTTFLTKEELRLIYHNFNEVKPHHKNCVDIGSRIICSSKCTHYKKGNL